MSDVRRLEALRARHRRELLSAAGAPDWVVRGEYATLWQRLEGSGPPWRVLDINNSVADRWSVEVDHNGRVVVEMRWAKYRDTGHLSESDIADMGFGGLGLSPGTQREYDGEGCRRRPIEQFHPTWAAARGGWPLAGDRVQIRTPDGLLEAVIHDVRDGGVFLPSGREVSVLDIVRPEPMTRYPRRSSDRGVSGG